MIAWYLFWRNQPVTSSFQYNSDQQAAYKPAKLSSLNATIDNRYTEHSRAPLWQRSIVHWCFGQEAHEAQLEWLILYYNNSDRMASDMASILDCYNNAKYIFMEIVFISFYKISKSI